MYALLQNFPINSLNFSFPLYLGFFVSMSVGIPLRYGCSALLYPLLYHHLSALLSASVVSLCFRVKLTDFLFFEYGVLSVSCDCILWSFVDVRYLFISVFCGVSGVVGESMLSMALSSRLSLIF